jgi:hypothetical protein
MFPLRLNLLPPDKKVYLQRMILTQFTKNILEFLLFFLCIGGITLVLGQSVLENYFYNLTDNLVSASNYNASVNKNIKQINRILNQTRLAQSEYFLWSPFLIDFTNDVPNGVVLTGAFFDAKKKTINISGKAETRQDLLSFQDKLNSSPTLESVDIPLSQLTEKENVTFSLTAKIK